MSRRSTRLVSVGRRLRGLTGAFTITLHHPGI
jgi:hypothetical protein